MRKIFFISLLLVVAWVVSVRETSAQRRVNVSFQKGANSATVKGNIKGYGYIDYLVQANEGQTLSTRLTATNRFTNAIVFDTTMERLEGDETDDNFSAVLPASGVYVIRVLMSRNEARRKNAASRFSLFIRID